LNNHEIKFKSRAVALLTPNLLGVSYQVDLLFCNVMLRPS